MDVLFLIIVSLAITVQKLAINPSIKLSWATFWSAVRLLGASAGSSARPLAGLALVCLNQVTPSTINGAKFSSREMWYNKFCRHDSNVLSVSLCSSRHCFGALIAIVNV